MTIWRRSEAANGVVAHVTWNGAIEVASDASP